MILMKLKDKTKEEIETMGYDDLAYEILKEKGKKMKTIDIFTSICNFLNYNVEDYIDKVAEFFTLLSTEKRFFQLNNGYWDLRENHTAKIEVEDSDDELEEPIESEEQEDIDDNEDIYLDETKDQDDDTEEDDLQDLVLLDEDETEAEL